MTTLEFPPGTHRYVTILTNAYWGPCGHRESPDGPPCGAVYSAAVHRAVPVPTVGPSPKPASAADELPGPSLSESYRDFYGMPVWHTDPASPQPKEQHGD